MTLKQYLARGHMSGSQLAKAVGVTRSAVSLWRKGAPVTRYEHVVAIVRATGGLVAEADLTGKRRAA